MTPERFQQIRLLFERTLELPPEERAAFLEQASTDDLDLRNQVQRMLIFDEKGESPIDRPAVAAALGFADVDLSNLRGRRIGPYLIEDQIGFGGMGVVYRASRVDSTFQKQVAIKLLHSIVGAEIMRHFQQERQILASLDHPNIARLLDGGRTEDGLPYFVMEYVDGKPIDAYCDGNKLNIDQRLALFRTVCGAVQYAHQNLVVHRDLKPSNILVTADGTVKLLDFGIAKLMRSTQAEATLLETQQGLHLLTPEYASPEQLRSETITTMTDVYLLGVLIYELLTGHRPYSFNSRALQEIARVICDQEPVRPSTVVGQVEKITTQGQEPRTLSPEDVSAVREGKIVRLRRRLAGDLDNIVMKALHKEPAHRYHSVEQFSEDIRRHLARLPIIARGSAWSYRASKYLRRNSIALSIAAVFLIAFVAGLTWQLPIWVTGAALWEAGVARVEAARAEKEALDARAQRATAEQERQRAEHRFNDVRKLANSILFELHDAILPLPGSTKARELLLRRAQEYLDSLAREAKDDVALQRELALAYQRIGDVLGKTSLAIENQKKSLELFKSLVAAEPGNLELQRDLGTSYRRICSLQQTSGKFQEALEACGKDLELREAIARTRPGNQTAQYEVGYSYQALSTFELAVAVLRMANVQEQLKEYPAALENARKAVALYEELSAKNPDDVRLRFATTSALQRVGSVLISLNDLPGALQVFEKSLPLREKLAAAYPTDARTKINLYHSHESIGWVLVRLGRVREADDHFRKQFDLAQRLVATDGGRIEYQRALAGAYENLGSVLEREKKCAEARGSYEKGLKILDALKARDALSAEFAQVPARLQKSIAGCK
jgi:non-specific serine/threonine protein kinase/serine/threonine-protein kinase